MGASSMPAYDLAAVRTLFPVTENGTTYLNHAGMSPLPRPVHDAMINAIEMMMMQGSAVYEEINTPISADVKENIAKLVNATSEEVALIPNTSTGMNFLAQGLPLQAGDEVLLCDYEFPSNVYPWKALERKDVKVLMLPSSGYGLTVEAIDSARTEKTRVITVSGVQFFSGRKEDLAALGNYCHENGLLFTVDAIQAAGIIPLDMGSMHIDAVVAGGQKALMAPPGQGFMVVRSELIERMEMAHIGALSVADWQYWLRYDLTPAPVADRFTMGTANIAGVAGLNAAVKLLLDLEIENIHNWVSHLTQVGMTDLRERGYEVITPSDPKHHANILTFRWNDDIETAQAHLKNNGIVMVAHVDREGQHYLRISTHCYNTEDEVLKVGHLLEEIRHG